MTIEQALQWARANCTEEAVSRLRSRAVAATLAAEVERLRNIVSAHNAGVPAACAEAAIDAAKQWQDEVERLRAERDELLAALVLWKETTLKYGYPYEHTAMLACDAAIANVTPNDQAQPDAQGSLRGSAGATGSA